MKQANDSRVKVALHHCIALLKMSVAVLGLSGEVPWRTWHAAGTVLFSYPAGKLSFCIMSVRRVLAPGYM